MKKTIYNNSGLGLVQVIIAAAMLGGLSLVVVQMSEIGMKSSARSEAGMEINLFMADIDKRLKGTTMCEDTFAGTPMAATVDITEFTLAGSPVFAEGSKYGKLTIVDLLLRNDNVNLSGDATGTAYLEVKIKKSNASGGREMIKKIPLLVNTDSSNNIKSCISDTNIIIATLKEEICNDLGGSLVSGRCTNITPKIGDDTTLTCDPTQEGRIRYDTSDKKILVCDGATWVRTSEIKNGCPAGTMPGIYAPSTGAYPDLEHSEVHYFPCHTWGGEKTYQCFNGTMVHISGSCSAPGP